MTKNKFNQAEYTAQWDKENMSRVVGKYKKDFVDQFKEACKELGITQSEVIRTAMQDTIKKANSQK